MNSKKTMGIIMLLLLTLFILLACDKNNSKTQVKEEKNVESVSVNNVGDKAKENSANVSSKNAYINARFAYRIEYPKEWTGIIESETQDGALIYYKDGNDIRTFCEKAPDGYIDSEREQYISEGKKVEDFYTEDGVKGIVVTGNDGERKFMHVIVIQKGNHYDVYGLVKPDFYKNNENNIISMAKSIKILN
ncbi:hypothetical protein CPAST_c02120 [Clostridium pasteurianum DSM 525 = ATCC 6013]|uniref:Lipoprotein n=1 Tax=Clostridium pasteurianum DSM 525 = ATCC 6013 TaxID=1262449 RepID=A0A0H3J0V7_CLOPA|nr:hypothetical protein CPAST_c02120 [Clostridium pasteurianum DSM 525 = ATCC 6013]AOZ77555.1 hypothetical protein AQ984_01025 [Clostridium pasteurianum]AJA50300.1 hypothetical protein CLPA_c02120 [Clostridium pasteurianum DSM 525 = ATCC 6013]AOZ73758.1 hypothetical protein AQ983_01025 [Clostridium pasteurianum DSM 525 = ATCC 6013]ELP60891.1 hypothetical protein F502_00490 [Clostridium pasteurianum DSM 525 = ATCC 6013]